jgi:glycerol kinase
MSGGLVLAIDQGTTNTKALAVAADGRIVAMASVPMAVHYPQPGWAEQSADDIWRSVEQVTAQVIAAADGEIAAIAISNQRETIVLWDAVTGEAIGPAVIWQCRRSAERCAALRAAGHADEILERTGLAVDPLFPAAKIAWLLDEIPGARAKAEAGTLRAGTVDAWLLWKLTGGAVHATDHSNASRTQLFNTGSLAWDERLGALFDVPLAILPRVSPSDSRFGETAAGVLRAGIPIHAMIGDSHAALFGHGVRTPGTVKATFGTGSSLMTLTERRVSSSHGLSGTIAWSTGSGVAFALEGNISVSGQAAAFMAELLGLSDAAALSALAAMVSDTNGVAFVPALVGLGAPHWRDDARGIISGLSLGTEPAHLARAALEAIAFQVADVLSAMEADIGAPVAQLRADGGASRNAFLMQFEADIIGRPVVTASAPEVSALGAAALAFSGLGLAMPPVPGAETFAPAMADDVRAAHRYRWDAAIAQTLHTTTQQGRN